MSGLISAKFYQNSHERMVRFRKRYNITGYPSDLQLGSLADQQNADNGIEKIKYAFFAIFHNEIRSIFFVNSYVSLKYFNKIIYDFFRITFISLYIFNFFSSNYYYFPSS